MKRNGIDHDETLLHKIITLRCSFVLEDRHEDDISCTGLSIRIHTAYTFLAALSGTVQTAAQEIYWDLAWRLGTRCVLFAWMHLSVPFRMS